MSLNMEVFKNFKTERSPTVQFSKIILNPGLTFSNNDNKCITNNTTQPMDITDLVMAMERQGRSKTFSVT